MSNRGYEAVPTEDETKPSRTPLIIPRFMDTLALPAGPGYPISPSPMGSSETLPGQVNAKRRADRRLMRLNTELLQAVVDGNLEEVKRCIDHDANANATCKPERISSCHVASFLGHTEILQFLLKNGAQLGTRDAMGRTPLHLAAWEGNPDCVKLLLDHASDLVNVITEEVAVKNKIPLEWIDSWDHDHQSVIDMLPVLEYGSTPLHVACKRTELICVEHLLAAGAELDTIDSRGLRPLDVVGENLIENREEGDVEFRYPGVLRALIAHGAQHYLFSDYNKDRDHFVTPLHTAVELESLDAINVLLEANFPRSILNVAGDTPMHLAIMKRLPGPLKLLMNTANNDNPPDYLDPRNSIGLTPLQLAMRQNWIPGVSIVLEAGADVTVTSRDGYTALHLSAASGNLDMMQEILSIPDSQSIIEAQNRLGETPLFCAITSGNVDCVKEILNAGASMKHKLHGEVTVFHRAAEHGHDDILQVLLNRDESTTKSLINAKDILNMSGLTALHMAANVGHVNCVRTLLNAGADVAATTTERPHFKATALHLAVTQNHHEVVSALLSYETFIIDKRDSNGWMPLHVACYHSNRECIKLLLEAGADLSVVTKDVERNNRTAMDFLIYNVPRPVEFLETIFDSSITINECTINEPNCLITLDYRILTPRGRDMEQMRVINALINSGNQFSQKRLLIHPLMESFLYLKWRALSPIFTIILALYAVFVVATTQLITGIYYYRDKGEEPPFILDTDISSYVLLFSLTPIAIQELLHAMQRSWGYAKELESWVKWGSFILSTVVVFADHEANEWTRHAAAVAVLLAWTELMFLLSRFPEWGYYVLMFSKVATNVIKVLLTFVFLVIGFTFSFLVQFRGEPPFGSPWQSFVKTMVMMTSEFDYSDLFSEQEDYVVSVTLGRLVFVAFLVLAAIVLMNLMVGLAVNDINDLEIRGKTQRLFKQVNFLCSLDLLVYNEMILSLFPQSWRARVESGRYVDTKLYIHPGRPLRTIFKMLPTAIKEDVIQNATANRKTSEPTLTDVVDRLSKLEQTLQGIGQDEGVDPSLSHPENGKGRSKTTASTLEKDIFSLIDHVHLLKDDSATRWEKAALSTQEVAQSLKSLQAQLDRLNNSLTRSTADLTHVIHLESM